MPKKIKPQFQVKISLCGTNFSNVSYGIWKDESSLILLEAAVANIAKRFVGKENLNYALMMLGLKLLSQTHKRYDELFPEYPEEKLKEIFKKELVLIVKD